MRINIFRDFLETSITKYFSHGLVIVSGILIAREFGPEGKGILVALLLIPQILFNYGNLGTSEAMMYYLSKNNAIFLNFKSIAMRLLLMLSLPAVVMFFIYAYFFEYSDTALTLAVGASLIPILTLKTLLRFSMRGLLRVRVYNLSVLLESVLIFSGVVIIINTAHQVVQLFYVYAAVYLFITILLIFMLPGSGTAQNSLQMKDVIKYGLKTHLFKILNTTESKFDILLITILLSSAEVGWYSVAVNLTLIYAFFTQFPISTVILPHLARKTSEASVLLVRKINRLVFWGGILTGSLLALVGKPLILFLYGAEFSIAYTPMLILLIGTVLRTPMATIAYYYKSLGRPEELVKISLITVPLNIVLCALLIPYWGITGAALATTLSYSLFSMILSRKFIVSTDSSIKDFYGLRRSDFDMVRSDYTRLFGRERVDEEIET